MTEQATSLDPKLTHYLAIGNRQSWGKAADEKTAIRNMNKEAGNLKATEYVIYRTIPETYVDEMGYINQPQGNPKPQLVKRWKNGKVTSE